MLAMTAYRDIVGGTRDFARRMDGTQEGDPAKAAAAIETALKADRTPLRLAWGADSVSAIRSHSGQLLKDLATWEKLGLDTRFERSAA